MVILQFGCEFLYFDIHVHLKIPWLSSNECEFDVFYIKCTTDLYKNLKMSN